MIVETVEMPAPNLRKYKLHPLDFAGKKFKVKNGLEEVYAGNYEDSTLVCYNLNKKFYRDEIHK